MIYAQPPGSLIAALRAALHIPPEVGLAIEPLGDALQQVGNPDPRSVAAIHEVMRQQRSGECVQAKLDAAWDAASAAAWAAARDAAWDAARDAAWDAHSKRLRRLIGLERRGQLDAEIARLCEAWGVAEKGGE